MLKVKGKDNLVRDENSRAIINTDSNALQRAKNAKRVIMQRIEREKQLEERVDYLEKVIESINKRLNDNE